MAQYGICMSSFIPVRKLMDDAAEMTTQLLFGDLVEIKDESGNWHYITQLFDQETGWADKKEILHISADEYNEYAKQHYITHQPLTELFDQNGQTYYLGIGSSVYHPDHEKLLIKTGNITLHSKELNFNYFDSSKAPSIIEICQSLINTTYLWGGKSFFGIDCSGMVQTAFRIHGINLPRNAAQQVQFGQTINFLSEAKPGDLVFFDNEEEKITHVGILLSQEKIIHASGKVRIDKIDHHGIYNQDREKYTHRLRIIKRVKD